MKKFRASYSTLNLWASGQKDRAIEGYFKLSTFITPQMEAGKRYHKEWEEETKKTNCMPAVFGGRKLQNPITERKIVVEVDSWLDLVGVIDLQDGDLLIDYKTGKTPASAYSSSCQPYIYQLLVPTAKRFEFHCFDQYRNKAEVSILYLTEKTFDIGLEWLITHSSDMHSTLLEQGLYERYLQ